MAGIRSVAATAAGLTLVVGIWAGLTHALPSGGSLPAEVVPLDQGWWWRAGDDPAYATAEPGPAGFQPVALPHAIADSWPRRPLLHWYRLRLADPPAGGFLAVGSRRQVSFEIYLDGRLVGAKGRIDGEPLITHADYVIVPLPVGQRSGPLEIALRLRSLPGITDKDQGDVAAGLDLPPLLGSRGDLLSLVELQASRDLRAQRPWLVVLTLCLASFLFHISLARAHRAGRECRYFAFLSLQLAALTWSGYTWDGELIDDAFLVRRIGQMAILLSVLTFLPFLELFLGLPENRPLRRLGWGVAASSLLLLMPLPAFCHLLRRDLLLLPALGFASWGFLLTLRSAWQGSREARILSLGMGCFLASCFSSVALLVFGQSTQSLVPIGFIALIGALTLALGERFKQLSDELDLLNRDLEGQVARRTAELAGINQLLAESEQAARAASRSKGAFLANMSHEIRTPLTGVLGMTSMLLRSELPAPQRQMVATIHSSGDSLLTILNDVLDFSKIEEARLRLDSRVFSPAESLQEVIDLFRAAAEAKGLELHGWSAEAVPAAVLGDPIRVRQILLNLLGNAIKFTPRGQVELRLEASPLAADRCRLLFTVRDTGIGIAAEKSAALFQPFSQLESGGAGPGGTGLGLAISQRLAQLMEGEISFHSELGQGSTFVFAFPAEIAAVSLPPASPAALVAVPPGLRVLVAEDNAVNREIVGLMLQELGATADFVGTGRAAIAAVRAREYDVLLMDLNMPELDGLEATRLIRSDDAALGRPHIIALTANAFPEDRLRCFEAGCDDFLPKPLRLDELATSLARVAPPTAPS